MGLGWSVGCLFSDGTQMEASLSTQRSTKCPILLLDLPTERGKEATSGLQSQAAAVVV